MSLKLYLLRHGQTTSSAKNVLCGSLDPELTPEGLEMAKAFAATYDSTPWQAVFCSPMRRTRSTAQPLCEAAGMEMQSRDELREINYGKWEGLSTKAIEQHYYDDYMQWLADPVWHPPTEGESAFAISMRALQVVDEIKQKYDSGNVLIVSHKATIRILLCNLLGIDVGCFRTRLACSLGSLSVVEFGANGPLLQVLADRTHLSEELRNLPGT